MQAVFEGNGVFDFLEQLFDTVVDLQSANENDVVGIELVKIILLTIPYAVASGGTVSSNEADPESSRTARFQEQAKALLEKTAIVAGNMLPMEGLIHTYAADTDPSREDIPMAYHSVIGLLQTQLTNEAESGWKLAFMPPFFPIDPKRAKIEKPQAHSFPSFNIPSPVNPGPNPLFPEAYFSLYTGQEIVTVPQIDNIAASLIRDSIVDTIDQLDFNREGCAKFLIELDQYWASRTFATRGMSFDTFKEKIGAGENIWKSEDVIIEAIFSQLFKLPNPQHKLIYYHSLITQCCKLAPAAIAPSLGRVIRTIYRNLDIMDLELAYRFLDWFSHHLSNFEFRWRWDEWYLSVMSISGTTN
jgi:nuclear cap-binding protein subunit 1